MEGKGSRLQSLMPGHCEVCPGKCSWKKHQKDKFEYTFITVKEQRTIQELLDRYKSAKKGKDEKQSVIDAIQEDVRVISESTMQIIEMIKVSKENLEVIALRKPNFMSPEEYMDQLIQQEQNNKSENYEKRIEMIVQLKKDQALIAGALQHNHKEPGEAWLEQLKSLV